MIDKGKAFGVLRRANNNKERGNHGNVKAEIECIIKDD